VGSSERHQAISLAKNTDMCGLCPTALAEQTAASSGTGVDAAEVMDEIPEIPHPDSPHVESQTHYTAETPSRDSPGKLDEDLQEEEEGGAEEEAAAAEEDEDSNTEREDGSSSEDEYFPTSRQNEESSDEDMEEEEDMIFKRFWGSTSKDWPSSTMLLSTEAHYLLLAVQKRR